MRCRIIRYLEVHLTASSLWAVPRTNLSTRALDLILIRPRLQARANPSSHLQEKCRRAFDVAGPPFPKRRHLQTRVAVNVIFLGVNPQVRTSANRLQALLRSRANLSRLDCRSINVMWPFPSSMNLWKCVVLAPCRASRRWTWWNPHLPTAEASKNNARTTLAQEGGSGDSSNASVLAACASAFIRRVNQCRQYHQYQPFRRRIWYHRARHLK